MNIGQREIGYGLPPYIIAELGVNHDGDVQRALALTRAAAEAGADAIKLQYFETDRLMSRASRLAAYQKAAGESDPFAMLRRLELPLDAMAKVVDLAHHLRLHAILTVFSVELVAQAQTIPFDAYKTASPDLIHKPLLMALASTGKPLIVSTGAAQASEVATAVQWFEHAGAQHRLALLQCVSAYPTPAASAALGGIAALSQLTSCPVGYSDHTAETRMGRWAVRCGARILEKHFTYDRTAAGPDHAASLDSEAFRAYVRAVRMGFPDELEPGASGSPESILRFALADPDMARYSIPWYDDRGQRFEGPLAKDVLEIERDVRTVSRQSIVASRALPAGHVLTRHDLSFKRPGTGLPPWRIDDILGMPLARAVEADMPLVDQDLPTRKGSA